MLNVIKIVGTVLAIMLLASGCLVDLHNTERTNAGLDELVFNTNLSQEARKVAGKLASKCAGVPIGIADLGKHHLSEGQIKAVANRALGPNSWTLIGENIAVLPYINADDPETIFQLVHDSYMASPAHRKNIMDTRYTLASEGWSTQNCNPNTGSKCSLPGNVSRTTVCEPFIWNAVLFVAQA